MRQLSLFNQTSQDWIKEMRVIAIEIALVEGEVSADDIRSRFQIPSGVSRNALGSLFKSEEFVWKGVKKSRTPSRAGSLISTWSLSNDYLKERERSCSATN